MQYEQKTAINRRGKKFNCNIIMIIESSELTFWHFQIILGQIRIKIRRVSRLNQSRSGYWSVCAFEILGIPLIRFSKMRFTLIGLAGNYACSSNRTSYFSHFHIVYSNITKALAVIAIVYAVPPPTPRPCEKPCPMEFIPICAGPLGSTNNADQKSFGNACVLANYNCQNNSSMFLHWFLVLNEHVNCFYNIISALVELSKGECPGGGSVRLP